MSGRRHNGFDVVGIVGSQGGLAAARAIVERAPAESPAALIYVQHRVTTSGTILRDLLRRVAAVPVHTPRDGDAVEPGTVYIPRADCQTTVAEGRFRVEPGRCLGDPLLHSLAEVYGRRSLAVVVSGRLTDGAGGLRAVKLAGGRTLVQAPETAEAPSMPLAALATGCADWSLSPRQLAEAIVTFTAVPGAAPLFGVRSHPMAAAHGVLASHP